MGQLTKEDLAQMNEAYFDSLDHEKLVKVASNLRDFGINLMEQLKQNSSNSSKPPSSDNPFNKKTNKDTSQKESNNSQCAKDNSNNQTAKSESLQPKDEPKRAPGKQPGSQGFGRTVIPMCDEIVPHYPSNCSACEAELSKSETSVYMGYYTYELEKSDLGIKIICKLHHYHTIVCECGHETKAIPGEGYVSCVEGRKKDLKLTEYVMIGPLFVTFIAALSVRYRMSRVKIKELISYWLALDISTGTIDRCIREAGVACFPVVEQLIEQLQQEELVHIDETPWYEKGMFKWLWVVVSKVTAIYFIGTRKKEELLFIITSSYIGWIISDGYGAYRHYERRQRCLAHLVRKAVAITGAIDEEAQKLGNELLDGLRGLMKTMSEGEGNIKDRCGPLIERLNDVCNIGKDQKHSKVRELSREILNDWDAVVAFVNNPELPLTNNEAERALRHAVIARRISFGTRTNEGSRAYTALLSVIETCLLRKQDIWAYIAQTIALGRKGIMPSSIPVSF